MLSSILELVAYGLVTLSGSSAAEELIVRMLNPLYVVLLSVGL